MAQVNFPMMIAIDWLSFSAHSLNVLDSIESAKKQLQTKLFLEESMSAFLFAEKDAAPTWRINREEPFQWKERPYGSQQYKKIYDIDLVDEDGVLTQFCTLCAVPTLESWRDTQIAIKLSNQILYCQFPHTWYNALLLFNQLYDIRIMEISRADICGDFIYLKNRVSGSRLLENIRECKWWKCGTVKVSENYSLPYNIAWETSLSEGGPVDVLKDGQMKPDREFFFQEGKIKLRSETMTFGTMASDAQVCIYDKTLELNKHGVKKEGQQGRDIMSNKEYIRDCHKAAGVFDQVRHTWRMEVRLRHDALFMIDPRTSMVRNVELQDLIGENLKKTYRAAINRYFRLVDATKGGKNVVDTAFCLRFAKHKERLDVVQLLPESGEEIKLVKKPYHEFANRFNQQVISKMEKLSSKFRAEAKKEPTNVQAESVANSINILLEMSGRSAAVREKLSPVLKQMKELLIMINSGISDISEQEYQQIILCKDVLNTYLQSESASFTNKLAHNLEKCSDKINPVHVSALKGVKQYQERYQDAEVLREASKIVRGMYDELAAKERSERKKLNYRGIIERHMQELMLDTLITEEQFTSIRIAMSASSPLTREERTQLKNQYWCPELDIVLHAASYSEWKYMLRECNEGSEAHGERYQERLGIRM